MAWKLFKWIPGFVKKPIKQLLLNLGFVPKPLENRHLIGMTNSNEQSHYERCAKLVGNMDGAVVDLGCWMCSTTISLAKGLKRHYGEIEFEIFAFDSFEWKEYYMDEWKDEVFCLYEDGEIFMPEARRRLGVYVENVRLVKTDLNFHIWDGGAIKLLLVDAMKSIELCNSIALAFYPELQKGSLLIHQDFKHYFTSWIHIIHYRLREYFELLEDVPGGTMTFQVLTKIPRENINAKLLISNSIPEEEADKAFDYSMKLVQDQRGKSCVAAAHIMHYIHQNDFMGGKNLMKRYDCYKGKSKDFDIVLKLLI